MRSGAVSASPTRTPDFVIIGAAKAATTRVTHSLDEHPRVYLPRGEIHYFSWHYDDYSRSAEWYEGHFTGHDVSTLVGENSNTYLYYPGVPERIRRVLPKGVKLIAILRHPINRAYSGYCMQLQRGNVGPDIARYLHPERAEPAADFHFLEQGLYHRHLRRYLDHFDRDQIKILFFEDLKADSRGFVQELTSFLGLDDGFYPESIEEPLNTRDAPVVPDWISAMADLPLIRTLAGMPHGGLRRLKRLLPAPQIDIPEMSDELRRRLAEYYHGDTRELERLVGRDLSHWLR